MSRAQLTSTVEQNTGGAVAPFLAGKNKIINGDFGIWARGTSFSLTASTGSYTADRFFCNTDGSGGSVTTSQQSFTVGQTAVPNNPTYYLRNTITTAPTSVTYSDVRQYIENVSTFAGQTMTISFYAQSSGTPALSVIVGQNFGSGGSSAVYTSVTLSSSALTTSWAKYTGTVTLPSISGKTVGAGNMMQIFVRVSNPTTGLTWDISNLQVEAGSVATPFTTASGTLQGELALCQRYYFRANWQGTTAYGILGMGAGNATTQVRTDTYFPVPLRVAPTAIDYPTISTSFTLISYSDSATGAPSAVSNDGNISTTTMGRLNWVCTSATVDRPYYVRCNNNSGVYFGWSAEL